MKNIIKSLFAVLLLVIGFSITATAQRNVKVTESFQYTKTPANGAALISNASGAASWGSVSSSYLKATLAFNTPATGDTVQLTTGSYNIIAPTDTSQTVLYFRLPSSPANGDVIEIKCTNNCNATTTTFLNGTVAIQPDSYRKEYIKLVYRTTGTTWY